MSSNKRLSRAVALLLIVAMLIPMTLVSATAETPATPRDISDYLTIHWDFEGETTADALKDKATANGVATDLQIPQEADYYYTGYGTAEDPYVVGDVCDSAERMQGSVSVVNGMATTNNADGYVYATPTADTEGVFQSADGGTWFFRYKVPTNAWTGNEGAALIDFRAQNGGRPLYIQVNNDKTVSAYPANVAKEKCTTWEKDVWETLVVRYDRIADNNHTYSVYKINDDLTMTRVAYAPGCSKQVSAEGVYISLFRHINEEVGYGNLAEGGTTDKWSGFGGWSIDDVRYYNISLTNAEIANVMYESMNQDHMTIHYDFEGEGDAALQDKATAGASKDDLYIPTDKGIAAGSVSVGNGYATAVDDTGVIMLKNATATADSKAMFQSKNFGSTFFMRFKMDARTFNKVVIPVDFRDQSVGNELVGRAFHLQWETGDYATSAFQVNWLNGTGTPLPTGTITANTWVNLMLRVDNGIYTVYLVTKNSVTEVAAEELGIPVNDTNVLTFFREWSEKNSAFESWTGSRGLTIDDVRYYDVAISNGMAQAIVKELATTINYDEYLTIHYDFEGEGDAALQDKATAGAVDDNLTAYGEFTIANGIATSNSKDSAMKAESSADTNTIFNLNNTGTWFLRYKNPTWTEDNNGNAAIVDFRQMATNSAGAEPRSRVFVYNLAKTNNTANQTSWQTGWEQEMFSWASEAWVNVAVIYRGANAAGQHVFSTLEIYEDGGEWKVRPLRSDMVPNTNVHTNADGVDLYLFREFHETDLDGNGAFATWSGLKGLSIDDVRYYNTALDSDDLIGIMESENGFEQVKTLGVQKGTGTDADTTKVRLVSEIRGIDFKNAGYKVQLSYTDGDVLKTSELTDLSVSTAYKALNADGSAIAAIKPFEGYYLIAVVIDNIPASAADLKITFTPYAANANGTVYEGVTAVYDHATGTVAKA